MDNIEYERLIQNKRCPVCGLSLQVHLRAVHGNVFEVRTCSRDKLSWEMLGDTPCLVEGEMPR